MSALRVLPLALACAIAGGADAQLKKAPSPAGGWSFATNVFRANCTLAGEMTVRETSAGAFSCSFQADWTCKAGPLRAVRTKQTCVATQSGDQLVVTSKLAKIVSADPADTMDWLNTAYAPDNFEVTINRRGDEMDGLFRSYDTAPVKFRRKGELIS